MFQLILNPVENLPHLVAERPPLEVHGLYVSDKLKTDQIMRESKIAFSGRSDLNGRVRQIYQDWARVLGASKMSMRLLSGLHAHVMLFMGLGEIGDTVLLLPERAGGHYATRSILERLGYRVVEMAVDCAHLCVDMDATIDIIAEEQPDIIFVDRSEGLCYEDFSPLAANAPSGSCCVFDASQYLTNIICGNFPSPLHWGFDIMMATLHKNFPGPQKAMVCSLDDSVYWRRIEKAMSSYVSSIHVETTLMAGEAIEKTDLLSAYSRLMLENSVALEGALSYCGLPIVRRESDLPTHHLWMTPPSADEAFKFFKNMESCGFLVNYRKLPYDLGHGIRLGTAAATLQGLNRSSINDLAELIARTYSSEEVDNVLYSDSQEFISQLKPLKCTIEQQMDNIS